MARPRKKIDTALLLNLATIGCATEEMATMLGCSKDTLERRYADVIEKGRAERNSSLRRKQYDMAVKGDRTMLIWLGKQFLGQRDKLEHEGTVAVAITDAREELASRLDALASAVTQREPAE